MKKRMTIDVYISIWQCFSDKTTRLAFVYYLDQFRERLIQIQRIHVLELHPKAEK